MPANPDHCAADTPCFMFEFLSHLPADLLGHAASTKGIPTLLVSFLGVALVAAASFTKTMVPLRAFTVASDVVLLVAAAMAPEPASMVLYLLLIPVNTYRLVEVIRITRRVTQASEAGDLSGLWLKPYMKAKHLAAGDVLFHKGDDADALYLLIEGELELVEIGKLQAPCQLFGEISFFSPERLRTLTARCRTKCVVLSVSESVFKQLYFQNPKLAFHVSSLIAHRLGADIQRLTSGPGATVDAAAQPVPAVRKQPAAAAR
jgi:CRP/FNR family transcriptional regulator, cyclic AMP receptor protein